MSEETEAATLYLACTQQGDRWWPHSTANNIQNSPALQNPLLWEATPQFSQVSTPGPDLWRTVLRTSPELR